LIGVTSPNLSGDSATMMPNHHEGFERPAIEEADQAALDDDADCARDEKRRRNGEDEAQLIERRRRGGDQALHDKGRIGEQAARRQIRPRRQLRDRCEPLRTISPCAILMTPMTPKVIASPEAASMAPRTESLTTTRRRLTAIGAATGAPVRASTKPVAPRI
jgi:hypothetical protein